MAETPLRSVDPLIQKWKWALWGIGGIIAVGLLLGPRIAQPLSYHQFADQRTFLGIPHFFDVVSNLGFLLVGVWGAVFVMKASAGANVLNREERWPYFFFFLGVLLTAFGSAYYHWAPDNARLLWDRLPMAMGFMGLLAAVLAERVAPTLSSKVLGRYSPQALAAWCTGGGRTLPDEMTSGCTGSCSSVRWHWRLRYACCCHRVTREVGICSQ